MLLFSHLRHLREGLSDYIRLERDAEDAARALEETRERMEEASAQGQFPEDVDAVVDQWYAQAREKNK